MPSGRAALALALGFVAGASSGLLGVGGGVVMVPGMVLALRLRQHEAHATSLAAIVPIGVVGFVIFASKGKVNYALAGLLVLGSLVGAPIGARAMVRIPERWLTLAFALALVAAGLRLIV